MKMFIINFVLLMLINLSLQEKNLKIKNETNISTNSSSNDTHLNLSKSQTGSIDKTKNMARNNLEMNLKSDRGIDSAQFLTPDEQCRLLVGKEASFCRQNGDQLCKNIYCRKSMTEPCVEMSTGAKEGTTCDSGKICVQGTCRENQRAPVGDCVLGDDLVKQEAIGMNLPSPQMTCSDVLSHIATLNQTPTAYCSNSNFRQICCETCKKYDVLSCTDRYFDCPRYKNVCSTATINGLSVMMLCPRTCQKCDVEPVKCKDDKFICQNDGKCVNVTVSKDTLFGFKCNCMQGFYGDLCEKKDSCLPNPCNPNEKCISYGNIIYKCEISTETTTTTKTTTTTTTTSTTTVQMTKLRQTPVSSTVSETTKKKLKVNTNQSRNPNCKNFQDEVCNYYAQLNLCTDEYYLNGKPITQECPLSCNKC